MVEDGKEGRTSREGKATKKQTEERGENAGRERGQVAAFKICDAAGLDFGGSAAEKADLVPRVAPG